MRFTRINRRQAWIATGTVLLMTATAAVLFFCCTEPAVLNDYGAGTVLLDRYGTPLRVRLGAQDQDCRPVDIGTVSPWAKAALIAAEDKRFETHIGVDPLALARALLQNLVYARRISGASTLSTQVIRLAEPRPRTFKTKLIEAVKAIRMERSLTKAEILEQHINRAPFGSNLTGLEAAARQYFDKSAGDLTLAEAALLMGLPQSPARLRPDRHPEAARTRMNYVLERMEHGGTITPEQRVCAQRQPLHSGRGNRPFQAPHFSDFVLQRYQRPGRLNTTIDLPLQTTVERIMTDRTEALHARQIHGAAVVVLEVATGAVRAMLGSPDYSDRLYAGMVNGAAAPRSPGSALKPFIYAMALDQGLITPGTMLDDCPTVYRDVRPDNFDGTFRGRVSARNALILSLNIPALTLTEQTGLQTVVDHLRDLGLSTLTRPAEEYGLGIALGGGETRLLDLVNAYACLARGGRYLPYRVVEEPSSAPPVPRVIFSAETAYMIADMLGGRERSMDIFGHIADAALPRIAWKTGTSSGYRDAWTVAWNPDYVVGVWLGNADGSPAPEMTGANTAAPIAGDIFRALCGAETDRWFEKPAGLKERFLVDGSSEWYIPGISRPLPEARALAEVSPALRITAPADGTVYRFSDSSLADQSVALQANAIHAGKLLHWFANGLHIGTTTAAQPLYWPLQKGNWTLTCGDSDGNRASISLCVEADAR